MLPKRFYQTNQKVTLSRTSTPTGMLLDPLDLATRPHEAWIEVSSTTNKQELKPKTLIFKDVLFQRRNNQNQILIYDRIKEAQLAGFTVLMPSPNGQLVPFQWDQNNPIPKEYLEALKDLSSEKMSAMAASQKISADNILPLNYCALNEMLGRNPVEFRYGDFFQSEEESLQEVFDQIMLETGGCCKFTFIDSVIENIQKNINLKKYLLENITYAIKGQTFKLLDPSHLGQITEFKGNDKELSEYLNRCSEHKVSTQIKKVEIRYYKLKAALDAENLLKIGAQLEEIKCESEGNTKEFYIRNLSALIPGSLKKVKELTLHQTQENEIITFIKAAPNIEYLNLESRLKDKLVLPIECLKNLKVLIIKGISFDVKKVLENTPNIETLHITKLEDNFILHPNIFNNLKSLKLTTVKSLNQLNEFLIASPNIETLSTSLPTIGNILSLPPGYLSKLKFLTLDAAFETNIINLEIMLKAVPNLENLTLPLYKFSNVLSLPPGCLKKLKKLELLQGGEVNSDNLEVILKAVPNIERLSISLPSGNNVLSIAPCSLLNLKELDLNAGPEVSAHNLESILKAAPNLKRINIRSDLSQSINLDEDSLSELKSMSWKGVLSAATLQSILIAAPHLKELDLNDVKLIGQLELQGVFPNVKHIDLRNVNFSEKELEHLKEVFPNATILESLKELKAKSWESMQKDLLAMLDDDPSTEHKTPEPQKSPEPPKSREALTRISLNQQYLNTAYNPQKTLRYTNYFPDLHPGLYRLDLWRYDLNSLDKIPIVPSDFKYPAPLKEQKAHQYDSSSFDYHRGVYPVTSSDGVRITLPSVDANEKVFNVKLVDAQGNIVKVYTPEEIARSESAGFSQITLPNSGEFTVHFEVEISKSKPKPPIHIQQLVDDYNSYGSTALPPKAYKNLAEFAKDIDMHRTGACRHRAIAAYSKLVDEYKDHIRVIENDVHAYLEIKIKNINNEYEWHKLDLGGYLTNKKQNDTPVFEPIKSAEVKKVVEVKGSQVSNIVTETKPTAEEIVIQEKSLAEVLKAKNPALIEVSSDVDMQEFLNYLNPEDIFVVHHPNDLSLSAPTMTQEGNILHGETRFKKWLDSHPSGQICVDIRRFKDSEIAQLNDLLDRVIEQKKINPDIAIKLIDHPARYYGPDFRRRVAVKASVHSKQQVLLPSNPEEKDVVEIDLFNSFYWRRSLIGTWKLKASSDGEGHSFYWEKGELLRMLETNPALSKIRFKNPPLHDPEFTAFVAELQSLRRIEWADQVATVKKDIIFSESKGYDWTGLCEKASIGELKESDKPLVLTDANILSFIQDPSYQFSKNTRQLEIVKSHLKNCPGKVIQVMCSYGLSESSLALFLDEARKEGVTVQFYVPSLNAVPDILKKVPQRAEEKKANTHISPINWQIHQDINFAARKLLASDPSATYFDLSSLSATDLGRYPEVMDVKQFTQTGKLNLKASLSGILQKLKNGEHVILSGKIPPSLYGELTSLSLGMIEGEKFTGKITLLTTQDQISTVAGICGKRPEMQTATIHERLALLQQIYEDEKLDLSSFSEMDFAELERNYLKGKQQRHNLISEDGSDLDRAILFDRERLFRVQDALKLNPWVMIPGATGIGKSHFLDHVLTKQETCYSDFQKWLEAKSDKNSVLIVDEASFASELSGQGENFLERFKSLRNTPPGILWKGTYYPLTEHHKVIFAFNPASYGAGRSTKGFLEDQAVNVSFEALPDYYVRARLINPLLEKSLKNKDLDLNLIANPLVDVYRWMVKHSSPDNVLITPRQIKCMVNLIASEINAKNITDPMTIMRISEAFAYIIGKQALLESNSQLDYFQKIFEKNYSPEHSILSRKLPEQPYPEYQLEAYSLIKNVLQARSSLQETQTDLGLGGVLLEGGSGIGKTFFINKIISEHQDKTHQPVFRISPSTPFHEKVKILKEAFEKGALVVAEEINTSLWPNKILNNYLMGLDEEGNPAKHPGFMLLATQNPISFAGRSEEDPALRQRLVKLKLDWPFYQSNSLSAVQTVGEKATERVGHEQAVEEKSVAATVAKNDTNIQQNIEEKLGDGGNNETKKVFSTASMQQLLFGKAGKFIPAQADTSVKSPEVEIKQPNQEPQIVSGPEPEGHKFRAP